MSGQKLESKEQYKAYKQELHQQMLQKQRLPYRIKVMMSKDRIIELEEASDG